MAQQTMQSSLESSTDRQLMLRVQSGDHAAFCVLVKRHTTRFVTLAQHSLNNRADAEDVVQDVFIKLWQYPSRWDAQRNVELTTWLYRVVLNACHDMSRKMSRRQHSQHINQVLLDGGVVGDVYETVSNEQQSRRSNATLHQAIARLTTQQKDAIYLVEFCGLRQKQAAEVMTMNIKAFESLLNRARQSLKQQLQQDGLSEEGNVQCQFNGRQT